MIRYTSQDVALALTEVSAALRRREVTIERYARVLPAQRTITYGSTWVRFLSDERGCAWSAPVHHVHWGRVLTVREYVVGRLEAGDGPDEIKGKLMYLRARAGRGWRLSLVHCDATAQPELRSVPLAGIWPCTAGQYYAAKAVGFDSRRIRGLRWYDRLHSQYRAETMRQARAAGIIGEDLRLASLKEEDNG